MIFICDMFECSQTLNFFKCCCLLNNLHFSLSMQSNECSCVSKKRTMFTKEQDRMLVNLVKTFNDKPNWKIIANKMGKSPKQCRERFRTYLAPGVTNPEWTPEEDERLRRLVAEIGKHWAQLREYFPGKSDNHIKNRYNFHIDPIRKHKQQQQQQSDQSEPQEPVVENQFSFPEDVEFEWNFGLNEEEFQFVLF